MPMPPHYDNFMIPSLQPISFTFDLRKKEALNKNSVGILYNKYATRFRDYLKFVGIYELHDNTKMVIKDVKIRIEP